MALTPQDVADALNAAGIDTPQKFAAMIGQTALLSERESLKAAIDARQAKAQADAGKAQAEVQALQQQYNDVQQRIQGLVARA